ncbi:MAG TPA: hypothetical protein VIE88_07320, partial [Vicinamibacteria bacterium]
QGAFKAEAIDERSARLLRDPAYSVAWSWPDTLLIRFFDEVADEEIALERGDVDAAIFWPGEASPHIRTAMDWQSGPSGRLTGWHLVVSVRHLGAPDANGLTGDERNALAQLNQVEFRGDLLPYPGGPKLNPDSGNGRFEVNPGVPGHKSLERSLNQSMPPGAKVHDRVIGLDLSQDPRYPESWDAEDFGFGTRSTRVFSLACPIVSSPIHRRYVASLAPDALVNLFQCPPSAADPK